MFRRATLSPASRAAFAPALLAAVAWIAALDSAAAAGSAAVEAAGQQQAAAPSGPDAAARIEALERAVADLAAASAASANRAPDRGVPLHGFADVGWAQRSNSSLPGRNGFRLGTLDFYLTPQISERVRGLVELAFEYDTEGALSSDLERVQLGYTFSDALTVWGGRFHTPYGYWNAAYHHGAQLQIPVTRPRLIEFEDKGGILPAHSIGVWASGHVPVTGGKLAYDVYVANGNRIDGGVLDFNSSGDDDSSPLVGFNMAYSPGGLPGLTVGLHGLGQTVAGTDAAGTSSGRSRARMLGGYAVYDDDVVEVIAEYYHFRNTDLAGGTGAHTSQAGFVQAAMRLGERWAAYARAERAALSGSDPYFALQTSGSSYRLALIGLRYDLDPRSALKLQFETLRDEGTPGTTQRWVRAQYAVRF